MTKLADRITKGEVTLQEKDIKQGETTIVRCFYPPFHDKSSERDANAELIAEAFNVTNATGKSPKELQEERDEAIAALDEIVSPILYMTQRLKEGEQLNGPMALALAKDPSYLRQIAERALKKFKDSTH